MTQDVASHGLRMAEATKLIARVMKEFELNELEQEAVGEILDLIARRLIDESVKFCSEKPHPNP